MDDMDDMDEPMPPAFQTVEVVLQSWSITDAGLNVELVGNLELQIGWAFSYPVRPIEDEPGILQSDTGILQNADAPRNETIWSMNAVLARYDEYCDDPDPQVFLSLLEVDEGFGDTGNQTRTALGVVALGIGAVYPVTGLVFEVALLAESLFARNDDVGQGAFTIEDGPNRLMLSGKDTRSIVTVRKDILSGACP